MEKLLFKQTEAKTVTFTCLVDGAVVDLSTATFSFMVKQYKTDLDAAAKITKVNADFGITSAATGILYLPLSSSDLNLTPGDYIGELKITFSPVNIDKSEDIPIVIEQPISIA